MRTHIGTEQDKVGTDLESEVNKARFYEKNQDGLYWTFSSTQAESLHHESTVTPAISFLGEPLHPVNPPHSNVLVSGPLQGTAISEFGFFFC